jgi:type I restriction enzyme M protein
VLAWLRAPAESEHAWIVKWGEEHRAADTAAAPYRAVAQAAAEEARAHARTLRDLKISAADETKLTAAEARLADAEARAKAAQQQADALYWPVFDLDNKNPRAKAAAAHISPAKLAARMVRRAERLTELLREMEAMVAR